MSSLDVRTFVVISTAHLTEASAKLLDRVPSARWPCLGGVYGEYGWFLYAHEENCGTGNDEIPDDIFAVMTWARKKGFEYVLVDCDGDTVVELPVHDW